ncbi:MAG: hypothetical protein ABIG84_07195 [archaeon]
MKKGQTIEILGFLALVVVVIISTLGLKLVTVDQKSDVLELAQESQEIESFNSGAKTIMVITEPNTKKTFVELMGLVGFFERDIVDVGPTDHPTTINVSEELTQKLDLIYGKGHWQMEIPYTPRYEIYVILLLDTSLSMEDEIKKIKENIVEIMDEVDKSTNLRIAYKFYFLPTTSEYYKDLFNIIVRNNPNFKTYTANCVTGGAKNEEWARGMNCIINENYESWSKVSAKVGIILSDEPTGGCEDCGCKRANVMENCCSNPPDACQDDANFGPPMSGECTTKMNDISTLSTTANKPEINMNIFTLQANACDRGPYCSVGSVPYTCAGREELTYFMDEISTRTNAQRYDIENINNIPDAIKNIVLSQPIPKKSLLLGTTPPIGKRVRSHLIPTPTPIPGHYVNVVLKQWS